MRGVLLIAALLTAPALLTACRSRGRDAAGRGGSPSAAPVSHDAASPESLRRSMEALRPLHRPMGEPQPADWLTTSEEPGQTFEEYLRADPVRPTPERRTLYVQPLGRFSPAQRRVVRLAADYMSCFFNLPVRLRDERPLADVPANARRRHPLWGDRQILAGHITMNILRPDLPPDAAALIAFTSADLYPDENFNFVFGQASLSERVGVWSRNRLGRPDADESGFKLTLLRTLKIATHETGHMFSLDHCTKYECVMSGSNHLDETDRHPLDACPECTAKICWATAADPRERYARLAAFCAEHGLDAERQHFEAARAALGKN